MQVLSLFFSLPRKKAKRRINHITQTSLVHLAFPHFLRASNQKKRKKPSKASKERKRPTSPKAQEISYGKPKTGRIGQSMRTT
jgi:hypothetical protein